MLLTEPTLANLGTMGPSFDSASELKARGPVRSLPDLTMSKVSPQDVHVTHTAEVNSTRLDHETLLLAFALVLAQYVDADKGQPVHILLAELADPDQLRFSSLQVQPGTASCQQLATSVIPLDKNDEAAHATTPTAVLGLTKTEGPVWAVPVLEVHDEKVSLSAPATSMDASVVHLMLRQTISVAERRTIELAEPALVSISCSPPAPPNYNHQNSDPLCWFHHWATTHPAWEAIIIAQSEDGMITNASVTSWTYGELNAKANELAALVRAQAHGDGPVGLCMPRTAVSYAALVAIFKAGYTYLPMDEQLPANRKKHLAHDSGCSLIITEDNMLGVDVPCPIINVSLPLPAATAPVPENSPQPTPTSSPSTSSDAGAYVLYTSGSTGMPKGVLVGRRNLCKFIDAYAHVLAGRCPATLTLGGKGRYLGLASRAFDVHIAQTFMAWRFGMALATGYRPLLLGDLKATVQLLSISHLSCVPSLLDQAALDPRTLPSLVFIGVGGEKLTERVRDTLTALPVLNAYGPTETTIMCTSAWVRPDSYTRNIGHVLPGSTALVVEFDDPHVRPVLRGHAGELCIVGDLVAHGYLNRDPALPSGFMTSPDGQRLYRTGDAARMMPDGSLHYLGRRDEQAKIRGQRFEPGEVSQCTVAGAKETVHAMTLIVQHERLTKPLLFTLIADRNRVPSDEAPTLLQPDSPLGLLARQAKLHCQEHLPAYMVPDLILPVSHLTLLAISGKTDARLLSAWIRQLPLEQLFALDGSSSSAVRALNEREQQIADTAKSILLSPLTVTPDTSVFELGFDSLTLIRLARALHEAGITVPLTRLRTCPHIREIAEFVPTGHDGESGRKAIQEFQRKHTANIRSLPGRNKLETVFPCLPLQESMVSLSLIAAEQTAQPDRAVYLGVFSVRFPSIQFDLEQVRAAAVKVSERYAIMRTCFDHVSDNTSIAQLVLASIDPTVQVVDQNAEIYPFEILASISTIPPWRFVVCGDGVVKVFLHHALYDAHSLPLLLDGLAEALALQTLEPPKHDLSDLIEHVASVDSAAAQAFWQDAFSGSSLSASPWDSAAPLPHPKRVRVEFPLAPLAESAARAQVTVASLVMTAVAVAFSHALGTDDLVLGQVLWGRSIDLAGAESIVAPCITTVPLALKRIATNDFSDLVRAGHAQSSAQLAYQHTSLRTIRRWVGVERNSLTDVLFSYLQPMGGGAKASRAWVMDSIEEETDAPAAVEAVVDGKTLRISAVVKQSLPEGTLDDAVERIQLLLNQFVAGEAIPLLLTSQSSGSRAVQDITEMVHRDMTSVELAIRDAAAQLAQVDPSLVNLFTPFLRIGIDSIVALRFAAQLRKEQGLTVSAHDVLSTGSIGALGQHLAEKAKAINDRKRQTYELDTTAVAAPTTYPCTPLQAGMLSGTLASPTHDLYVHHHSVILMPEVDMDKLAEALDQLVALRDILRTGFVLTSTWQAHVYPSGPRLQRIRGSLTQVPHSLRFDKAEHVVQPPWRAWVLHDDVERQSAFVLSMHHALYDGISLPALFSDLRRLYLKESVPPRPPFSLIATHVHEGTDLAVDHYAQTLQGLQSPSLIAPRGPYKVMERRLSMPLVNIKSQAQALQVSLQAVMQLAWAKVLASVLGHRDVCFGQVVAGRFLSAPGVQAEDACGPLINTIAVRVTVEPVQSNMEALQKAQQESLKGQAFEHAPLSGVLSGWRTQTGYAALFDSLLVFHNVTEANSSANEQLWTRPRQGDVEVQEAASEYPVNVSVVLDADGLRIRLGAPMNSMVGALDRLVETVEDLLLHPSRPSGAFPQCLAGLPISPAESVQESSIIPGRELLTEEDRKIVVSAMATKLQVEESVVNSCHNLFLLGVDSLLAIAIASQARDQGVQVTPHDLLAAGTVSRISRAKQIQGEKDVSLPDSERIAALAILGIDEKLVEAVVPTLPRQTLKLNEFVQRQRRFMEATFMWETQARLDPHAVEKAWSTLRDRHQVLRSTFVRTQSDKLLQVVLKPGAWYRPLNTVNVPPEAKRDDVAFEQLKALNASPTDFFVTPGRLTHLSSETGDMIMLTVHHAQYDVPTIRMFAHELSTLLLGSGNLSPPAQWTEFVDYSLRTVDVHAVDEYIASLVGAEDTLLCHSGPLPEDTQSLTRRTFSESIKALEAAGRAHGVGLSHVATLAVARALAKQTKTIQPTFRFLTSGRTSGFDGIDRLAGFATISRPMSFAVLDTSKALAAIQTALIAHSRLGQAHVESPAETDVSVNLIFPQGNKTSQMGDLSLKPLRLTKDSGFFTTQPPMPGKTAVDWPESQLPAPKGSVSIDIHSQGDALSAVIECSDPKLGTLFPEATI